MKAASLGLDYTQRPDNKDLSHLPGAYGLEAGQSAVDMMGVEFGEEKAPAILKGIDDGKNFAAVFEDRTGMKR
mgnify:CR=1 FL=1